MLSTASAEQIVEREVRELVRRRRLDPRDEHGARAVRLVIDEVITDYQDRSLTAAMPPLSDPAGVARTVHALIVEVGPLQPFFDDPSSRRSGSTSPARCSSPAAGSPS